MPVEGSYVDLIPSEAPSAEEGRIYYDTTTKKVYYHNGTEWKELTGAGALSKLAGQTWDSWPTADELATAMESKPESQAAAFLNGDPLDIDFGASILNSANLTASKIALILFNSSSS